MNAQNEIPIVYITDNNYAEYAGVSITSLFMNKKKSSNYKVYILAIRVCPENIKLLKSISPHIEIMEVDNKYESLKLQNKRLSPATFLKSDIPNIFTNYDKVLYLDCDTTVEKDLTEFFNTDIGDYYAGVVKDLCPNEPDYKKCLPVEINEYFNAGIMLFNCKKNREDKILDKILDIYQNGKYNDMGDQNAFNICWNNNLKFLSPIYNCFSIYHEHHTGFMAKFFKVCEREIVEMKYFPTIIHYTGLLSLYAHNYTLSNNWHKYYKKSVFNKNKHFPKILKLRFLLKDTLVLLGICNKDFSC